jgi:hypothetical protein
MPDEQESTLYRWTIRTLYATVLILNAAALWSQVKDSPEGLVFQQRVKQAKARALAPLRAKQHFQKTANQVIFEAVTIVEGTNNER